MHVEQKRWNVDSECEREWWKNNDEDDKALLGGGHAMNVGGKSKSLSTQIRSLFPMCHLCFSHNYTQRLTKAGLTLMKDRVFLSVEHFETVSRTSRPKKFSFCWPIYSFVSPPKKSKSFHRDLFIQKLTYLFLIGN